VAGPIERRRDLLPQVEQFRFHWSAENIDAGAPWIVAGIFFKLCLADNVSGYFYGQSATNPYVIWMDNLLFGLRIYYDFAGYSLVAVGLGLCFGIKLTLNFRSPYCSTSSVEFWRRWHISLSQWFRDYVYVPMGGGRTSHWVFNVAVVFVVSGIWHGAGWNFMMWGALHGLFLIVNRLWGKNLKTPALLAWAFTNGAALFAWLCFYETRPGMLWAKLKTLLTPAAYSGAAWQEALANRPPTDQFVMACFVGLAGLVLLVEWLSVARKDDPYYYLRRPVVSIGLVLLTIFLAAGKNNVFIYFAF
jgi:alginate O-acetyltransferase complex protein AlgI